MPLANSAIDWSRRVMPFTTARVSFDACSKHVGGIAVDSTGVVLFEFAACCLRSIPQGPGLASTELALVAAWGVVRRRVLTPAGCCLPPSPPAPAAVARGQGRILPMPDPNPPFRLLALPPQPPPRAGERGLPANTWLAFRAAGGPCRGAVVTGGGALWQGGLAMLAAPPPPNAPPSSPAAVSAPAPAPACSVDPDRPMGGAGLRQGQHGRSSSSSSSSSGDEGGEGGEEGGVKRSAVVPLLTGGAEGSAVVPLLGEGGSGRPAPGLLRRQGHGNLS